MGHQHDRRGRDQPNGRKILIHVIAGMSGQAYAREHHNQRVAVGRGLGGGARTDNGACARAVLDDDLLAKGRREFLRNHSAHRVRTTAGRVWHDQRNRTRRIGLRPGDPRDGRQRGSARCQMQEFAAGKFHGVYVCSPPGSRTVNTEPLPGSLVTVTSPPIMRASLRVMARPSPVPPNFCAVAASAWVNSSNSLSCCSAVMPMPVSETTNSTKLLPLLSLRAASLTSPALVNLQALLRRLSSICLSRMGSTASAPRSSGVSTVRRFLFWSASCRAVPMTSSIRGASCTV